MEKWIEFKSGSQKPYYYNRLTGKSQTQKPDDLNNIVSPTGNGIILQSSSFNTPYYYDFTTKTSQWGFPTTRAGAKRQRVREYKSTATIPLASYLDEQPVSFSEYTQRLREFNAFGARDAFANRLHYQPSKLTRCTTSGTNIDAILRNIVRINPNKVLSININNCILSDFNLLTNFPNLQILVCDNDTLTLATFIDIVNVSTNLVQLSLDNTDIGNDILIPISRLSKLQILNLGSSNINGTTLSQLQSLKFLSTLDISDNDLEDITGLENLSSLTQLEINSCGITENMVISLTKLPNLTSLDITANEISDIGLYNIVTNLHKLEFLDISHNGITITGARYITQYLPNIKELVLDDDITDEGIELLNRLPHSANFFLQLPL